MKKQFYTVGPAQLFYTVDGHIKEALKTDILSISHRSSQFEAIFKETSDNLRKLFNIPASHYIAFTGSATEIWERLIQNTVERESFHLVNGAFSEKFANISENLGRKVLTAEAEWGNCVEIEKILVPETAELIAITHNETSTGAQYPEEDINKLAKAFPNQIIAVDMVSSAPLIQPDWSVIDTAYFSVQKAFGLPAGLGVWVFNDRCVEKSHMLLNKNISIGSYHSIPELLKYLKKNQTPETPNILNLYLLGRVVKDMLEIGMDRIRRETIYKSAVLYQAIEQNKKLAPFVKSKVNQSKTTIVAESVYATEIRKQLAEKGLITGAGYAPFKDKHIRIANFPTHSKEQIEMLADLLVKEEF
ncbi:MAG: aminotransferase class V-fold PLP-dependent enzyme [Candidatus Cyclobacteriaceae bacterium M2_1C_046]